MPSGLREVESRIICLFEKRCLGFCNEEVKKKKIVLNILTQKVVNFFRDEKKDKKDLISTPKHKHDMKEEKSDVS